MNSTNGSGAEGPDLNLFQDWVVKNYGGNSRTKTITKEKYTKICSLLRGENIGSSSSISKFRFWVRSKGFRLLRHDRTTNAIVDDAKGDLYVSLYAKEVCIYFPTTKSANNSYILLLHAKRPCFI